MDRPVIYVWCCFFLRECVWGGGGGGVRNPDPDLYSETYLSKTWRSLSLQHYSEHCLMGSRLIETFGKWNQIEPDLPDPNNSFTPMCVSDSFACRYLQSTLFLLYFRRLTFNFIDIDWFKNRLYFCRNGTLKNRKIWWKFFSLSLEVVLNSNVTAVSKYLKSEEKFWNFIFLYFYRTFINQSCFLFWREKIENFRTCT